MNAQPHLDQPKTIVLGVTACVGIYKACEILRSLQKAGVRVKVLMTQNATHFIDPALFRALTREPVAYEMFEHASNPIPHISLAQEADLLLVAPCTANALAKFACGIADDLMSTTFLATAAPILIAPAMNTNMYLNPATQENIATLKKRGVQFVDPDSGYLACGDSGPGRLADVDQIVSAALAALDISDDLAGKNVIITSGPTREPIDPVRYLSNYSSGKTGAAYARQAASMGANVCVITGPTNVAYPAGVEVIPVETAQQMLEAVESRFDNADVALFTAAVADYRPAAPLDSKAKKDGEVDLSTIALVENPDILATMGSRKKNQIVIGYAAETENLEKNARIKLAAKHADIIVGNLVGNGRAFGTDENEVILVSDEASEQLEPMGKDGIAKCVLHRAADLIRQRKPGASE